ncbi:MAG: PPC domain-containing DNA-binding protein [Bacteroidota bacterium]
MKPHAIRLHPGDDLKKSLESFIRENGISSGAVLTCVGSLQYATLRMANVKTAQRLDGTFEILSLVGTLSEQGCHLHISLSDKNGSVTGGHLLEGCPVFTTAELVIVELTDLVFSRAKDQNTGFNELVIRKK